MSSPDGAVARSGRRAKVTRRRWADGIMGHCHPFTQAGDKP